MGTINKLNRRIFGNNRFSLDFFMYAPYGSFTTKDQSSIYLNYSPVLLLKFIPPKYAESQYDYTKSTFKITPRNLFKVVKLFNTMMEWMYSDKYNDLFMVDENNELIFNADYSKLYTNIPPGNYDQCYIKAFPAVINLDGRKVEGVNVLINDTNNVISMTHEEVSILFNYLKNCSFSNEVMCALAVYEYIKSNDSYGENKRLEGKTPFD